MLTTKQIEIVEEDIATQWDFVCRTIRSAMDKRQRMIVRAETAPANLPHTCRRRMALLGNLAKSMVTEIDEMIAADAQIERVMEGDS